DVDGGSRAIGMHNWFTFYHREQNYDLDFQYWGYRRTRSAFVNGIHRPVAASVAFDWDGHFKAESSFLVGTSPEFDLAVYTMCFLINLPSNTCLINVHGVQVRITTMSVLQNVPVVSNGFRSVGRNRFITTAYPSFS
ncbi:Protein K02A11.3, partial [Aphelenchoides avenae]